MPQPRLKVGLFGGSFNPAHSGHMHVARTALNTMGLDQVWWMVSPGNPLKDTQAPYDTRVQSVLEMGLPSQMRISHFEIANNLRYTRETILAMIQTHPDIQFVWLMGSDNLLQFPEWKNWQDIFAAIPIAVIARPGESLKARLGKAARIYAPARIRESQAGALPYLTTPAWVYLTPPLNPMSSTRIRKTGHGESPADVLRGL